MIKINNLRKTYSNGFEALKGVNINIDKGKFFGLLGPNGAGKTTTIGILTGLINLTSGSISVDGLDVIKDISEIYQRHWIKTEILSASIRGVKAVSTSFALGAHVVTMPPNVFAGMYKHILTDKGLELFDKDQAAVLQRI